MQVKTIVNYSPNFESPKRIKKDIKFLIFHYTGMKKESSAISRLTKIQSEVSTHYFIKNNGKIISMVPDLYIAWHAGKSRWQKYKSLNKNSIGVEISNPGHKFGYKKFSARQIKSLIKLSKILIKKYKIKKNFILGHSDIAPDRKLDPGEKFPWEFLSKHKIGIWYKINKKKLKYLNKKINITTKKESEFIRNLKKLGYSIDNINIKNKSKLRELLVKAFQRRFRPKLVNGKIDQECLLIIDNLNNIRN